MHCFILSRSISALVCLAAIAMVGCSGKAKGPEVSGTVQFDGKPLSKGLIHFEPEGSQGRSAARVITDGKYSFPPGDNLTPGTYKVSIRMTEPDNGQDADAAMKEGVNGSSFKNPIPAQYNDRSELKVEVTAEGPNEFPFDLKAK